MVDDDKSGLSLNNISFNKVYKSYHVVKFFQYYANDLICKYDFRSNLQNSV